VITNIINRGDRPLFNRKYLMALVWLLPVAIIALNSLTPSSDLIAERIAENQLWLKSESTGVNIYFNQGSGLTSNDKARQTLLLEGLELRLASPEVQELLEQQQWVVRPQLSSLTTQLQIDAKEPVEAQALQQFIELLRQPPAVDWIEPIERINAQIYLASQNGRQRALDALLSSATAEPLAARTYVELVDRTIALLYLSEETPKPIELAARNQPSTALQGKSSVAVRAQRPATLLLWRLDAPSSAKSYLVQQTLGGLVSAQLAQYPNMRLQQQLTPEGSLVLLEAGSSEADLNTLLESLKSDPELLNAAIEQLQTRWETALEQRPEAWAEVLLLYAVEPQSLESAFSDLRDSAQEDISEILQHLKQPADRRARLFTATSS